MYAIYSNTYLNHIMNLISLLSLKQELIAQTLIYLIIKCMDTLFFHCDSTTKAGGVGTYTKNTIDAKHIQELSRSFYGCESLWIKVGLNKENIIIGVVYRHPHNDMNVFQESFMQTLHKLTVNKKYVMGEFNIDLLKASNNHVLDDFVNLTNCFGLRNLK